MSIACLTNVNKVKHHFNIRVLEFAPVNIFQILIYSTKFHKTDFINFSDAVVVNCETQVVDYLAISS